MSKKRIEIESEAIAVFNAIHSLITDGSEAEETARKEVIALSLVADKHGIELSEAWEIVKVIDQDPSTPVDEPTGNLLLTREQKIYWDWIAECDLLGVGHN